MGSPDSGVRAFMEPLLAANDITSLNTELVPLVNLEALRALQAGQVDAAFLMGPAQFPAIWQALHDPDLKLMSLARAEAYPRRFPYITKLTLPAGTIDLAEHIPAAGGEADRHQGDAGVARWPVARRSSTCCSKPRANCMATRAFSRRTTNFRTPRRSTCRSPPTPTATTASGPACLHRYLPFTVAAYLERLIVLLVPVLFVIVPLTNFLPRLLRWRMRSRIYRWYGELALLERDVGRAPAPCPSSNGWRTWTVSSRPPRASAPR